MMALKLLPIFQVIIILCSPTYSYPAVYGTKRYGRLQRASVPTWNTPSHLQPYQQMVRTQRYPLNYYDVYPYGSYPEDYYYPQEMSYPVYYPPARTSKYEVYQAVLPYYFDKPVIHNGFGYYGYDDNFDLDDDVDTTLEDAQPIGQKTYYENDNSNSDNINDVNAAFLQNLIMTEMYKDSLEGNGNNNNNDDDEVYGKLDEYPPNSKPVYYNDDENVSELKQLAGNFMQMPKQKELSDEERLHWFQRGAGKKQKQRQNSFFEDSIDKRDLRMNVNSLPISDRKAGVVTTASPVVTTTERRNARGQKEEVMLRPATPVKHPFNNRVMGVVSKKDRQRTPSVYDTIKHMLDMEKSLENGEEQQLKPKMRKRIVSSEDSLTHQLSVLKKQ